MEKQEEQLLDEELLLNEAALILIKEKYHFSSRRLYKYIKNLEQTDRHFLLEAAVVIDTDPLLIAIEHSLFNSCVVYRFPSEFVEMFDLKIGTKLVSKNNYYAKLKPGNNSLIQGPTDAKLNSVTPFIMNFCYRNFAFDKSFFSDYYCDIVKNKALFAFKIVTFYFDGITKEIGGTKDDFHW